MLVFRDKESMAKLDRREFLGASIGALALGATTVIGQGRFDPEEKTVAELSAAMARGTTSSVALTSWYLSRAKALDPKLRSLIDAPYVLSPRIT